MSRIQQAIASKKGSVTTFMKRVAIACPGTNRNRENQRPSAKPIGVIRYRSFDRSRASARKQSSKRLRRLIPASSWDFGKVTGPGAVAFRRSMSRRASAPQAPVLPMLQVYTRNPVTNRPAPRDEQRGGHQQAIADFIRAQRAPSSRWVGHPHSLLSTRRFSIRRSGINHNKARPR